MSFDLETILGFLFVIFFVILPIFSKRRKGGQPSQPGQSVGPAGPQGPQAGGSPRPGREGGAATASTAAPASARPQQAPATNLQATLDEIRQRVQEAQQQEKASASAPRASGVGRAVADSSPTARATGTKLGGQYSSSSADPFGSGMVSGQYTAHGSIPTAGSAHPPSRGTPRHSAGSPLGREGRHVGGLIESAAPMEVTRTKRSARRPARPASVAENIPARRESAKGAAKLSSAYLGTTQADLVRGMIWHEVLAEPVAYRRLRRLRSRPR